MKILILLASFFSLLSVKKEETTSSFVARSYVVLDSNSNKILEGYDYNLVRSVASISKIMTAILAIESGMLENFIQIPSLIKKVDGSMVYLEENEVISLEELVYGLMLRSGNDCAVSIAYAVSGNLEEFVELMNRKAQEIEMKNTIFHNPSGLDSDDGGNQSTALDIAKLMAYAMKNESFRKITSTNAYRSSNHGIWVNKNKLLRQYEYAIGGKTGYTKIAKRTLVSVAKKNDTELIVVTLDCGSDFAFHKSLYEKNFANYFSYKLIEKGEHYIADYLVYCPTTYYLTTDQKKDIQITYHLKIEDLEMEITSSLNNEILGTCTILKEQKESKKKESFWDKIKSFIFFWK